LNSTIIKIKEAISRGKDAWAREAVAAMMQDNSELTIDEVMGTISKNATWLDRLYNPTTISNIPAAVLINYI
jgi:hypothetical protein